MLASPASARSTASSSAASAPSPLRDRINDSQCVLLVTADGGYRRGQVVPLKKMADEALEGTPSIRHVVVVRREPAGRRQSRTPRSAIPRATSGTTA